MIKGIKDRQRIIELLQPVRAAGNPLQIIFEELPHVTPADIAEVAAVLAEESRMDAAEYEARADGKI
jgi:hypothetical protein